MRLTKKHAPAGLRRAGTMTIHGSTTGGSVLNPTRTFRAEARGPRPDPGSVPLAAVRQQEPVVVVGAIVLARRHEGVRQGQAQLPVSRPLLELVLEEVDALARGADAHQREAHAPGQLTAEGLLGRVPLEHHVQAVGVGGARRPKVAGTAP